MAPVTLVAGAADADACVQQVSAMSDNVLLCGRNASEAFFMKDVLLETASLLQQRFGNPPI